MFISFQTRGGREVKSKEFYLTEGGLELWEGLCEFSTELPKTEADDKLRSVIRTPKNIKRHTSGREIETANIMLRNMTHQKQNRNRSTMQT